MHNSFFIYTRIYSNPLHVSSTPVLIIRRINCINTTSGMSLYVGDRLVCRFVQICTKKDLCVKLVIYKKRFKPLKSSGHYMYHQFNIQQFYVLPKQCIYVFCVDL